MSSNPPDDYSRPARNSNSSADGENASSDDQDKEEEVEATTRPTTSFVDKLLVQAYSSKSKSKNDQQQTTTMTTTRSLAASGQDDTPEAEGFQGPKSKVQNKSYSISPNNLFSSIVITQLNDKIRSKEDIDVQVIRPDELHLIASGEMLAKCAKLNEKLRRKGIKSSKSASSLLNNDESNDASFTANLGGILDVSGSSAGSSSAAVDPRQYATSSQTNMQPQFDTAETHSLSFCYYVDEEQQKELDASQLNDPCIDFKSYSRRKASSPNSGGSYLRALSAPLYRQDAVSSSSAASILSSLRSKSKDMGRIEECKHHVGSQTIICGAIRPNPTISTQTSPDLARRSFVVDSSSSTSAHLNQSEKSIGGGGSSTLTLTSETFSPLGGTRNSQQHQDQSFKSSSVYSPPPPPPPLNPFRKQASAVEPPVLASLEPSSPESSPKSHKKVTKEEEPSVANYQSSSSSNSFHSAISSSVAFSGPTPAPRSQELINYRDLDDFDVNNIIDSSTASLPIATKVWSSTSISSKNNGTLIQTSHRSGKIEDIYDYQKEVDDLNSRTRKPFRIECNQEFRLKDTDTAAIDFVQSRIDSAMTSLAEDLSLTTAGNKKPSFYEEIPLYVPRKQTATSLAALPATPKSPATRSGSKSSSVSPSRSSAALKAAATYPLSALDPMDDANCSPADDDDEPVLSKLTSDRPSKTANDLLASLPAPAAASAVVTATKPKWETSTNKYSVVEPTPAAPSFYHSQQRLRVSETPATMSKPLNVISNNNPGIKKKVLFHDWENLIDNLAQEQEKQRQIEIERSRHHKPTPFSQQTFHYPLVPAESSSVRTKAAEQFKNVRERYGAADQLTAQRVDSESPPPPPLPPRPHKMAAKVVATCSSSTITSQQTTTSKTTYLSASVLKSNARPLEPEYVNMPRYENDQYFSVSEAAKKQAPPQLSRQYQSFEVLSTSEATPAPAVVQTTSPSRNGQVTPVQRQQQESYTHLTEWQSRRRANSNTSQSQQPEAAESSRPGPHNNYKNPLLKSSLSAENVNNDPESQDGDELDQLAQNMNIDGTTPSLKRFYLKKNDTPDDALSLLGLANRHQPRQNLSQNDLNVIEKQQRKQVELLRKEQEQKQQQQQSQSGGGAVAAAAATFTNESNLTGGMASSGTAVSAGSAKISRTMLKLMNSTIDKEYEKLMRRVERRRVRVPQILEMLRNGQIKGKEKKKLEEELRYLMRRSDKDQILLKRFLQMAQNNHAFTPLSPSGAGGGAAAAFDDEQARRKNQNRDTSDENRLSGSEDSHEDDDDDEEDDDDDDNENGAGRVAEDMNRQQQQQHSGKVRFKLTNSREEPAPTSGPEPQHHVGGQSQVSVVASGSSRRNEQRSNYDTEETTNFESSSAASFATIDTSGRSRGDKRSAAVGHHEVVENTVEAKEYDDKIHLMMKTKLKILNGQRTKESGYSSCDESGNEMRRKNSSNKSHHGSSRLAKPSIAAAAASSMHAIEDVNEYQAADEYISRKQIREAIDKANPGGQQATLARAPIYQSEYVNRPQQLPEHVAQSRQQSYHLAQMNQPRTIEHQRADQYNYEILNPAVSPRMQAIAADMSPKISELAFEFAPRNTRQQASIAVLANDGSNGGPAAPPGARVPIPVQRQRTRNPPNRPGERDSGGDLNGGGEHTYMNEDGGLNANASYYHDSQYMSATSGAFTANDSFTGGSPLTNISVNSSFSQVMHPRGQTSNQRTAPTASNNNNNPPGLTNPRTGPVINRAAGGQPGSNNNTNSQTGGSGQGGSNSNLNNNSAAEGSAAAPVASDVYTSSINYNANTTLVGSTVVADSANIHIEQRIRTRSKSPGANSNASNRSAKSGSANDSQRTHGGGSSNSVNQPAAPEFRVEYVNEEELGVNYRNNYQVQIDYETGDSYIMNYLKRIKYIIIPTKPKQQPQQPSQPPKKEKSPMRIDINNNNQGAVQVQRVSKPPHEQSQSEFIVDYIQEDDLVDLYLDDYEIYTDRDTCESILYNRNNPTRRWIILPTNWRHTTYYAQQDVDIANFKVNYCAKTRRRYIVDETVELGAKVVKKSFIVPLHCISSKKDFLAKWDHLTKNPIVVESLPPSPSINQSPDQHSPIYSIVQKKKRSDSINSMQSVGSLAERTISEPFISDSNQVLHLIHDESGELGEDDDENVIINYVEERIFNAELNANRLTGLNDAEAFYDPDTSEPILVHPARPNVRWIILPDNWQTSEDSPYITQEDVNLMDWDVYEDTVSRRKYIIDEKSGQRFYLVHTSSPAPLDDALSSNFKLMWMKLVGSKLATTKPLKSNLKPRIPSKRSKSSNELENMENFESEPTTSRLRTSAQNSPERLNSIINRARANHMANNPHATSMTSTNSGNRSYTTIKQPGKMGHLIPNTMDARANPPVSRRPVASSVGPKTTLIASNKPRTKSKSPGPGVKKPSLSKLQQDALRKQFLSQKIPDIGKLWMHQLLINDINKKKRLRIPFGYRPDDGSEVEYDPNYRTWRCLMKGGNDPTVNGDDGSLDRQALSDCQIYGYNKFNAKEYYRDRDNSFYPNSLQDPNRCAPYSSKTGTDLNSRSHAGFGGGDSRFAKGVLTEHFKESRQYEPRYITRNHRALVPKARLHLRQQFLCTPKYMKGAWSDIINKDAYHLKPRIILINDEERILSANRNCNVYVQYMYENDAVLGANPAYQLMLPDRGPTSPTRPLLISPKQLDRTHKLMNNSNSTLFNRHSADIALREAPVYVYHSDGSAYFENIAQYLAGNYAKLSPKTVRKILQFSNMKEFEDYLASKITRDEAKRIAEMSGSALINVDMIKRDLLGSISFSDQDAGSMSGAVSLNSSGPLVYHQNCEYDPLRPDNLPENSGGGSTRLNKSQDSSEPVSSGGGDLNDTQEVIIAGNLMKSTFIGFKPTGQVQLLSYDDLPDSLLEAVQDADQLDYEYLKEKEKENQCDEMPRINYSTLLLSARMKNLPEQPPQVKGVNFYGNRGQQQPAQSAPGRRGPVQTPQQQPNKPKFDFQATLRAKNTNDYSQPPAFGK